MLNTRTYVRLLRHLGIALIFAPEPFTTPFGVAFILAARHLAKRHETGVNNRLRETIRYYLAHTSHFSERVDGGSGVPEQLKRQGLNDERPVLGQITGSRSIAESPVRHVRSHTHGGRASHTTDMENLSRRYTYGDSLSGASNKAQKVTHHTIDMEWLSRRYESANCTVAQSSWATSSDARKGVTHHSMKAGPVPQHDRTSSVRQAKAKSPAVNVVQSRRRHDSAISYRTVARALQDNNFNYDILSKRNVIGGY